MSPGMSASPVEEVVQAERADQQPKESIILAEHDVPPLARSLLQVSVKNRLGM
jgi:hypothetical protein